MVEKIKKYFPYVIIVVLIILFLLQRCGGDINNGKVTHDTITETVVNTVTVTVDRPVYVPQWKIKTEYKFDTIKLTKTDTIRIIEDYFATYFYQDSIKIKDTMMVYIADSIQKNKIKSRHVTGKLLYSSTSTTNTVIQRKNEFYIGLGLVGSKTGIGFFGPELMLRTKRKSVYGIGIGVDGNLQPNLSLRTYWKIGKK